ncbi:MAG TPA: ATP-dependent helicase [Casimicrobiaceae bacterium]|nr:ATP-dependent helicase [Casimicrobiaceae bacterium]
MAWNDGLDGVALTIAGIDASSLRVMAGPGTGKSFAMKRRVARLLEAGADPTRILAVTFTRNAAHSLVKDLGDLGLDGCDEIKTGTLHAFCFWLLRQQHVFDYLGRVARPLITFTSAGVLQYEGNFLLEDLIAGGSFGHKRDCTKRIRAFEAAWARLQSQVPGWPPDAVDKAFHSELLRWLRFHRAMLIGEVVPEALRFLRNNPASWVLRAFDHVIVDEYQDLNRAEQELIDLLAAHGATAIVGDVDQSIYRFRHANPEGIEEYSQTHANTHDESLTECRRCPLAVVQIADHLIRHNHHPAAPARLIPKPGNPAGSVRIVQWASVEEEAQGLSDCIAWLVRQQGYQPGEILVLTPRRLLGYLIRDGLQARNVPVHSFYHEEALDSDAAQRALAVLTLLVDREDRVALRWWLGHGSPSARKDAYRKVRTHCEEHGLSPWNALVEMRGGALVLPQTSALVERFSELETLIQSVTSLDLAQLVDVLLPADAGCDALREAAVLAIAEVETVEELVEALKTVVSQPEMPEEGDYVRVMSLHKSKGLTSRATVVAGCVHGLIPFEDERQSANEQEAALNEQRRLFYVAITRCTERLVLSSFTMIPKNVAYRIGARVVRGRAQIGRTIASQFWAELGPDAPARQSGNDWRQSDFA